MASVGADGGLTGEAATGGAGGGVASGNVRRTTAAPAASPGGVVGSGSRSGAGPLQAVNTRTAART